MKLRLDYVTNSSSSSFVLIAVPKDRINGTAGLITSVEDLEKRYYPGSYNNGVDRETIIQEGKLQLEKGMYLFEAGVSEHEAYSDFGFGIIGEAEYNG